MNRKHILFYLLILVSFSCAEKDYSAFPPTWYGFTYKVCSPPDYVYVSYPSYIQGNPIALSPGDSIHITAHQEQRGRYIYAADYNWTICFDTIDAESGEKKHVKENYPKPNQASYPRHTNYAYVNASDDPVCALWLPENALHTEEGKPDTIKFTAVYHYSTGYGKIYETGNIGVNTSVNGRIVPQSNSIDGGATGYIYFTVSN